MNTKQLKRKFNINLTPKRKVEILLEEVMEGQYGTKNRVKLFMRLNDIKDSL